MVLQVNISVTLTYDRYLVSSWGRAGSLVITQMLQHHLQRFTEQKVEWFGAPELPDRGWNPELGYTSRPWSVIHSHLHSQFNTTEKMGVVICLRKSSEQALSAKLAKLSGYQHVYEPWYQQYAKRSYDKNPEYYSTILCEVKNQQLQQNFSVDCHELEVVRKHVIEWNNLACAKMKYNAVSLTYDNWCSNLVVASKQLSIDFTASKITMQKDPAKLQDRVSNREEVQAWLDQHREQDAELIETWRGMLLENFPPVSESTTEL